MKIYCLLHALNPAQREREWLNSCNVLQRNYSLLAAAAAADNAAPSFLPPWWWAGIPRGTPYTQFPNCYESPLVRCLTLAFAMLRGPFLEHTAINFPHSQEFIIWRIFFETSIFLDSFMDKFTLLNTSKRKFVYERIQEDGHYSENPSNNFLRVDCYGF